VRLQDGGHCFACGPDNPIGLRLDFRFDGDDYVADFTPGKNHEGFLGLVHGGIQATLLDEAMARLAWVKGHDAVTAQMECRFRKAVPTGRHVRVVGRIEAERGRVILASAELRAEDGELLASATAKMLKVRPAED
jgi:acyl-coenzyme A thioesterase PaaI-like protein